MIDININKAHKSYGFNKILNNLNIEINTGEIVALIGENGCGKSTILKIIKGEENINEGTLSIRKNLNIGYLQQIPPQEEENITVQNILDRNAKISNDIINRYHKAEKELANSTDKNLEKNYNKFLKIQEEYLKTPNKDEIIGKIIKGFKINNLLDKLYNNLSGGEKAIVTFASLMIQEPDILLLDEPTNHLDIETLEWLENYLKKYNKTILIVSHDRYFIDKVATKTILIEDGHEIIFNGNYSYYLKENEERLMKQFKDFKDQQKQIKAMKESIKKLREYGHLAGDTGGENFFKRAKAIEKRLDKINEINKPITKKNIPLEFSKEKRSGKEVIKINKLNLKFDKPLFENAQMLIRYQEHICLMGKNGSGKSTLLKEILNNTSHQGSNVKIGYIPQEIHFENEELTILEEARKHFFNEEHLLRSTLYKFMFIGNNVYKKIKTLSGGEKVRLKLFILIQEKANLLILDEPTNHIDINTREILEEALNEYDGTLLFVSHDRFFINKVAKKIIHIEDLKLIEYLGNYDYMKNKR